MWWSSSNRGGNWGYAPYVPVRERAAIAAKQIAALEKKGEKLSPVVLKGTKIATTFWGKAWCENLEGYSDYDNRLPRGRTYVRNRAVIDLRVEPGKVSARVQGTSLYTIKVGIDRVDTARWKAIVAECSGKIDSVVALLRGSLPDAVMKVMSSREAGLFPAPREIHLDCSCPDWATMCKHVAAVLYGVGARLDTQPELLFRLRGVDPAELTATAVQRAAVGAKAPAKEKRLDGDIASVFGIDSDPGSTPAAAAMVPVGGNAKREESPEARATVGRQRAANGKTKGTAVGKANRAARAKAPKPVTVTATALRLHGVPPATVSYWLRTGVLLRTGTAGVYEETNRTRARLARYGAWEGRADAT